VPIVPECPLGAEIGKPLPIAVDNRIGASGGGALAGAGKYRVTHGPGRIERAHGRPLGLIPKRVFDPLHGRMFRVLHLDPIRRRAAAIGAVRCFDTRPSSPNSQALRNR
jgi:hypothetical protein